MSRFGVDARPRPRGELERSMPAFGLPIGPQARKFARTTMKDMAPELSKRARRKLVDVVAYWLEKDEPHTAMLEAHAVLDLTGSYRLIAVLATPEASCS